MPLPELNSKYLYYGFNQGIGMLMAIALQYKHNIDWLEYSNINQLKCKDFLRYDFIFITTFSNSLPVIKKTIKFLEGFKAVVVLGGIHASMKPDDFKGLPYDILVRGEGEDFMIKLCKSGRVIGVKGVYFEGNEKFNGFSPIINDLDSLPFPYRYKSIEGKAKYIVGFEVITSRGCAYNCTYCTTPVFRRIYPDFYRRRSPENVIDEIIKNACRYRIIGFHDDHFLLDKRWLYRFLELYRKYVKRPFWCNSRPEAIDNEIIIELKRSGLIRLHMGIEAGDYNIRKKFLERDIDDETIINAFLLCKKHGIKTLSFNIIGFPFDTEENILKLIRLNRIIRPDWIHVSRFQPYPGTQLNDYCKKNNININISHNFYSDDFIDLPYISSERLSYYFKNFVSLIKK